MNPSNAYWTPRAFFLQNTRSLPPLTNTTGFLINLPWPDPVSTPSYYGENPVWGRKEYGFSTLPELYAIGNIMPTTAGIPRVNPHGFAAKANRTHSIVRI